MSPVTFGDRHVWGEYRQPTGGFRHPNGNSVGRPSPPTSVPEQQQAERVTQKANQLKQQYPSYLQILQAKRQRFLEVIGVLNSNPDLNLTNDYREDLAAFEKATVETQDSRVTVTDVLIERCSVAPSGSATVSIKASVGLLSADAGISIPIGHRNGIKVTTTSVDRGVVSVDSKECQIVLSQSELELPIYRSLPRRILEFPQIGLQTAARRLYVCAEGGGGNVVNANRTQIREWETFTAINYNSEHLEKAEIHHGDKVCFVTDKGFYVRSNPDGGMAIEAGHPGHMGDGPWEPFTILSKSGVAGPLEDLEEVLIKDFLGRFLIAAEGGGGGIYKSTNPGLHETFILCKGPKGLDPQVPPRDRPHGRDTP